MSPRPDYAFSDLTAEQIESYMQAARRERALAARGLFLALGRAIRRGLTWLRGSRRARVWRPKSVPALSPPVYR